MSIDGTTLDVADTPENEAELGRPGTGRGEGVGAFPQLRLAGVAECGTHAGWARRWVVSPVEQGPIARGLLRSLSGGMLLIADRHFYSFKRPRHDSKTTCLGHPGKGNGRPSPCPCPLPQRRTALVPSPPRFESWQGKDLVLPVRRCHEPRRAGRRGPKSVGGRCLSTTSKLWSS